MDHTPTTPVEDDRPLKILDRTPVPEAHKERLFAVVRTAQEAAAGDGVELQGEFGKEAVAMIVKCNQFVRLFRGGDAPGAVEFLLNDDDKQALAAAGYTLGEPEGMIFKMFGWVRVDPMAAELEPLLAATRAAYLKAKASGKA